MKGWQFGWLVVLLLILICAIIFGDRREERRLQYIQEVLEEQWTIMDSDAYAEIDRYKDMPESELFEPEEF